MAEDRSVILSANTNTKVNEFDGVFGMPNLDKLALHLKCPEYQKEAKIEVKLAERNGKTIPTTSTLKIKVVILKMITDL